MPNHKAQSGFTIIETLVAITILMIAIAGPLVIATKSLTAALYARDQSVASFLAQESMELIKSKKDNNIASGNVNWLEGLRPESCSNIPGVGRCDLGFVDPYMPTGCDDDGCSLNNTDLGFSSAIAGDRSIYKRYFYLSNPVDGSECFSSNSECTATVVVTWNEGAIPYEMKITSQISSAFR